FRPYFKNLSLPEGNYVEASRLFIDKERVKSLSLQQHPISLILFLSMINYAKDMSYQGIYAIVSHPMLIIFQRSGWQISVIETGLSEKNQNIYLIYMPVDEYNQQILINRINETPFILNGNLKTWPLSFSGRENRPDKVQFDPEPYGVLGIGNT
ncbi:acyl-homoserine-lactone synthase, partial [Yersinia massiliensis]